MIKTTLTATYQYEVPDDLRKAYEDRVKALQEWLEAELIKRNVQPTKTYRIKTDDPNNPGRAYTK
jgi:hypothetical protein